MYHNIFQTRISTINALQAVKCPYKFNDCLSEMLSKSTVKQFNDQREFRTMERSWPASCQTGIVKTTDDDRKQQVPSVASVYNS